MTCETRNSVVSKWWNNKNHRFWSLVQFAVNRPVLDQKLWLQHQTSFLHSLASPSLFQPPLHCKKQLRAKLANSLFKLWCCYSEVTLRYVEYSLSMLIQQSPDTSQLWDQQRSQYDCSTSSWSCRMRWPARLGNFCTVSTHFWPWTVCILCVFWPPSQLKLTVAFRGFGFKCQTIKTRLNLKNQKNHLRSIWDF